MSLLSQEILNNTSHLVSSDLTSLIKEQNQSISDCLGSKLSMDGGLGLIFNEPLLYICLSLTSLVTALVASKTLVGYHKHLKACVNQLKIHLVDWFLFFFTAFWLISLTFPYGCCVIWRWVVTIYMKVKYGPLGDIATGLDSAGSVDIDGSRQIIKSLKVLKGKCDIEVFRQRVEATACKKDAKTGALVHPKFHQYLDFCGGYYCWKPAKFDMNHHVRFIDGLNEESKAISETQALELVSKYSNEPFDVDRGYWEILVIPNFYYDWEESLKEDEREEKFAILVRISHGIGDGFSFLKLVMRDMAGVGEEEYVPPSKPSGSPLWFKVCVGFYMFFKSPRAFYKEMIFKDVNEFHNEKVKISGEKIHLWSEPIDIEWLKGLKKQLGSGMSTILLESLSGACRSYLIKERGVEESELPKTFSAIIPVPAPNHPDSKLVNKFSIVMMPLELRTENVTDRCRLIEREHKIMSQSPDAYMNLFLMDLVSVFPVSLAKYFIINRQSTTVISNLPGPTKSINIWGFPLLDTMFWLPNVGSSGLSISYLSYENKLRIGLAVDTGVISEGRPGVKKMLDWMIQDLKSLATEAKVNSDNMFINMKPVKVIKIETKEEKKQIIEKEEDSGYCGDDENNFSLEHEKELINSAAEANVNFNMKENEFIDTHLMHHIPNVHVKDVDARFLMSQSQCVTKCQCSNYCSSQPLREPIVRLRECSNTGRS